MNKTIQKRKNKKSIIKKLNTKNETIKIKNTY